MKTKEKLSRDFVATIGAWQMGFKCGPQEKFVRFCKTAVCRLNQRFCLILRWNEELFKFSPIRGRSSQESEIKSKLVTTSSDSLEPKKFKNPSDALETSAYIDLRKAHCITGKVNYTKIIFNRT